jgi:zinc/manganese transport system ATP-binding protein
LSNAAIALHDAKLAYGSRTLWDGLDLQIAPGEFVAVLGPNGSGKTSLVQVLLGKTRLAHGTVQVAGGAAGTRNDRIGYIPQQKAVENVAMRARDVVGFGLDGHKWGLGVRGRKRRRELEDIVLTEVGAMHYADKPVQLLSGGEQQRLRVAQALISDPDVLLCDEPLLSLDMTHQRAVCELIDRRRRAANTAVVFVTHEINPILPMVDRVLYLVDGKFRIGTVAEVMTSETLTELYGSPVDVVSVRGQLVVVGSHGQEMELHS